MLEILGISVYYGQLRALHDVSLRVDRGEIVSLVGPNGAGKSTALKAASGVLRAEGGVISNGMIRYLGARIDGMRTDVLARKGLCLVPEG